MCVPDISQSSLSDRTHQVEHWGCGCVSIVLASASAVEAVDTAHHCSSQRPCLGRMRQCGTHCHMTVMSSVSMPETVGGRPRCSTMNQTSSALLPCDEGHRLRLSHHTGVLLPNTRKSARSRGQ